MPSKPPSSPEPLPSRRAPLPTEVPSPATDPTEEAPPGLEAPPAGEAGGTDDFDDLVAPEDEPLPVRVGDDGGTVLEEPDFALPADAPPEPDTAGTPLDDLLAWEAEDTAFPVAATEDAVVLPWRIDVRLPPSDRRLPAVLDPTRADSAWVQPEATGPAEERDVDLGPITIRVVLVPESGPEDHLRLGRDALAGRILVRSG